MVYSAEMSVSLAMFLVGILAIPGILVALLAAGSRHTGTAAPVLVPQVV